MAKSAAGEYEIAETLKMTQNDSDRMIDLLEKVNTHLNSSNDGNKIYNMEKVTIARNGDPLRNLGSHLSSVVSNDSQVFVFVDIQIDSTKTVAPISA